MTDAPRVAIIGGSGLCTQDIFKEVDRVRPETSFGLPSDYISICEYLDLCGRVRHLAFLPRHGAKHTLAPHQIPYRANIDALRKIGVRQIIATCIAGSLRRRVKPGSAVVPDQFVNLTWGRDGKHPPEFVHLPMATPYCQELRGELSAASRALGIRTHQNGTVAVIQGPRFSTIAESRWFARQGWDLVNMTQYPECYFAREAGLCYAVLAMITDYDVGVGRPERFDSKTSIAPILRVFHQNISNLKALLPRVLKRMPTGVDCGCSRPLPQEYYKQENSARKTT